VAPVPYSTPGAYPAERSTSAVEAAASPQPLASREKTSVASHRPPHAV
jgi:hypothetical protein